MKDLKALYKLMSAVSKPVRQVNIINLIVQMRMRNKDGNDWLRDT